MSQWGNTPSDIPTYLNSEDRENAVLVDLPMSEERGYVQGWNLVNTYTASDGTVRVRHECLVSLADVPVYSDAVEPSEPSDP